MVRPIMEVCISERAKPQFDFVTDAKSRNKIAWKINDIVIQLPSIYDLPIPRKRFYSRELLCQTSGLYYKHNCNA